MTANGPYRERDQNGKPRWRVRYGNANKMKSKTFGSEEDAAEFAAGLRRQQSQQSREPGRPKQRDIVGESSHNAMVRDLTEARIRIMAAMRNGDVDLLQASRVLAQLAASAAKYTDYSELEGTVQKYEQLAQSEEDSDERDIRGEGRMTMADEESCGIS